MNPKEIIIKDQKENLLFAEIKKRTDVEAARLKRYLSMPDLSRSEGSPIKEIVKRIITRPHPDFACLDIIRVPEIVPARESFDLFNFPPDHPARSHSDTYYVNDDYLLLPLTTVMWYYYFGLPEIRRKIENGEAFGAWSYGKVYRKDEIDRHHMNVFHQIDGVYLCRADEKKIGQEELKQVLLAAARAVFGANFGWRFNQDNFPYTHSSLEMEINLSDSETEGWVEILGSGVVEPKVLEKLNIDPKIWNGWAFGSGLERLAILSMDLPDIRLLWSEDERVKRQLKLGSKYKDVSKFPPVIRDISFIVDKNFVPNDYFDLIRDIGGNLAEEVSLTGKYNAPEKFGANKTSYTYRIVYQSNERTLTKEEVAHLQEKIEAETKKQFDAVIR